MLSHQAQIPRRRNGRTQACEPCRRRKVSCGHEVPVCLRCRRRNTASDCVYVVDGQAMQFGPASGPQPSTTATATARLETLADAADSEASMTEHRTTNSMPLISPSPSHVDDRRAESAPSPPVPSRNPGYLGPTSFSAVFLEAENSLASVQGQASSAAFPPAVSPAHPGATPKEAQKLSPGHTLEAPDTHLLDLAIGVLQLIPSLETGHALFRRHINPNDGWNRLVAEQVMLSIYETFGTVLRHRETAGLREMAQVLTQNSRDAAERGH